MLITISRRGKELIETGAGNHLPKRAVLPRISGIVHGIGNKDAELLLFPDMGQRLLRIAVQRGPVTVAHRAYQRLGKNVHVMKSKVHSLRARRRYHVRSIASQEQGCDTASAYTPRNVME